MPAKSETFLLKFSYNDTETGDTVNEEGVHISYPVTATGFEEVLTATSELSKYRQRSLLILRKLIGLLCMKMPTILLALLV